MLVRLCVLVAVCRYLYLIQDASSPISLKTHVFNTEAHPLTLLPLDSVALKEQSSAVQ
jgi:Glycosyl hydrolase family 47